MATFTVDTVKCMERTGYTKYEEAGTKTDSDNVISVRMIDVSFLFREVFFMQKLSSVLASHYTLVFCPCMYKPPLLRSHYQQ